MKESAVFLIAHQCHSIYFAHVCLGLITPHSFVPYCMCWFTFRAEPVSKPEKLVSQRPLLHVFIMANFRNSEFQMESSLFPLFSFTLICFSLVHRVLTEVFCDRKTNSSFKQHFIFRTNLQRCQSNTCAHRRMHTEKKKYETYSCELLLVSRFVFCCLIFT